MGYKLVYFENKGAAEITRYVLACAGADYEDKRITREEWASTVKAQSPTGVSPMLETETRTYTQSLAIARFFANKYGFAGKTEEEKLHADMIVDTLKHDLLQKFFNAFFEKDETRKQEMVKEVFENSNKTLGLLEEKCIDGEGYFLASGFSWADMMLYNVAADFFPLISTNFKVNLSLDSYPKLKKISDNVSENPAIKKWVETRPVTEY